MMPHCCLHATSLQWYATHTLALADCWKAGNDSKAHPSVLITWLNSTINQMMGRRHHWDSVVASLFCLVGYTITLWRRHLTGWRAEEKISRASWFSSSHQLLLNNDQLVNKCRTLDCDGPCISATACVRMPKLLWRSHSNSQLFHNQLAVHSVGLAVHSVGPSFRFQVEPSLLVKDDRVGQQSETMSIDL